MLVTAYRDPASGQLFESEEALTDFQVKDQRRRLIESTAQSLRDQYDRLCGQMAAEVADVRDLSMHFKAIYEAWFAWGYASALVGRRRSIRKNLMKAVVDSVELDDIELLGPDRKDGPMRLRLEVEVSVTGDLDWYESEGVPWSPSHVLAPFKFTGSGNTRQGAVRKQLRYHSGLVIDLPQLPSLAAVVDRFGTLMLTAEKHQREVDAMQETAAKGDVELKALSAKRAEARAALDKAESAFRDADHAYEVRETQVNVAVHEQHPFPQSEELTKLTPAVGELTSTAVFHLGVTYHLRELE